MIRKLRFLSLAPLCVLFLLAAGISRAQIAPSQETHTNPAHATINPNAQTMEPMLPPVSVRKAQFFKDNPEAWSRFVAQLPRRPAGEPRPSTFRPQFGGTWQVGSNSGPAGACNPLLLGDGTVIAHSCNSPAWYKLTPDIMGSYVNGTWTQIASLPVIAGTQYQPQYHASAVLPDGRVIIMGGEYNGSNTEVWTNLGAIYDPVANSWTPVSAPSVTGWTQIGDAESTVLADGTFMLAACCGNPDIDALLDATTLTWTSTGAPSAGDSYQDEQGYELLPNGNVLTIDVWTNYPNGGATNAEQYDASSGAWISAGNTTASLPDPSACGNWEIGPAVLRPDGTLVAFGGNSGCVAPTADPTSIYNSTSGTWSAGPNVPPKCGTGGTNSCTLADAPAALLPNGNILFAASAGYGQSPTHFFEFTSTNVIDQVADTVDFAGSSSSFYYNFLVLPNGQILSTDFSSVPEFYTPTGSANSSWAPVISTAPSTVDAGATYSISGTQLNGLSQGAYYGDDAQGATNYPIVRITNSATGHVFYARTVDASSSSIAPGSSVSANFTVPETIETGASTLVVVANGIPSEAVSITVGTSSTTVSVSPTALNFGNQVVNTTSVARIVTLTNTGSSTLTISSIVPSADFAISANTCKSTLAAAGKCKVSLTFTPTGLGKVTGTLTFNDSAGSSPQIVTLTGTGVKPATLAPASLTYASQTVGTTSVAKSFTLTNYQTVTLTGIVISTTGDFAVSTTTCTTSLAAKKNCKISVVFSPLAKGTLTGTLEVTDGAVNSPQSSSLKGTGK